MSDSVTKPPRIYADFNGLVAGVRDPTRVAVVLDTFGTARDLSNAGVTLHEGCELIAYDWSDDEEDLEGHGTAHFDPLHRWWVAEFDEEGVRYVPKRDRTPVTMFRCICCRQEIPPRQAAATILPGSASDVCPSCSTPIFAAIAPPMLREIRRGAASLETRWRTVAGDEAETLELELRRELPSSHVLQGRLVRAVARRVDCDDVAFEVEGAGLCIVHLTWRRESDSEWPFTIFVEALPESDDDEV